MKRDNDNPKKESDGLGSAISKVLACCAKRQAHGADNNNPKDEKENSKMLEEIVKLIILLIRLLLAMLGVGNLNDAKQACSNHLKSMMGQGSSNGGGLRFSGEEMKAFQGLQEQLGLVAPRKEAGQVQQAAPAATAEVSLQPPAPAQQRGGLTPRPDDMPSVRHADQQEVEEAAAQQSSDVDPDSEADDQASNRPSKD